MWLTLVAVSGCRHLLIHSSGDVWGVAVRPIEDSLQIWQRMQKLRAMFVSKLPGLILDETEEEGAGDAGGAAASY